MAVAETLLRAAWARRLSSAEAAGRQEAAVILKLHARSGLSPPTRFREPGVTAGGPVGNIVLAWLTVDARTQNHQTDSSEGFITPRKTLFYIIIYIYFTAELQICSCVKCLRRYWLNYLPLWWRDLRFPWWLILLSSRNCGFALFSTPSFNFLALQTSHPSEIRTRAESELES